MSLTRDMEESNDSFHRARFAALVKKHPIDSDSSAIRRALALFFDAEGISHQQLATPAARVLRKAPEIAELISAAEHGGILEPGDLRVFDHPLMHKLLRRAVVTDLPLESLLVAARSCCLNTVMTDPAAR